MMNSSVLFSDRYRRRALGWLSVCLALVIALVVLLPRASITSSVLALLPPQTLGSIPPALNQGFMQRLDRQLLWLVSTDKEDEGAAVAQWWLDKLQGIPALQQLKGPMSNAGQQAWGEFFYQHRNGLIDAQTRQRLASPGGAAQADWVLAQLYSAFAGVSAQELQHDPLMLVRGAQLALQQTANRLRMEQGWLVAQDQAGRRWYLIHGELAGSSYNMQQVHQLVTELRTLEQALQQRSPHAQLLSRGTLFYSDYASGQAQHDIATLGTATVLGVLLLILAVFRSVRPLLLCLLSVTIGALAGTVATLLMFGELHLMTLLMSISLLGISADYALYYLTERMVHGNQMTPQQSLQKVLPTLLMALGTTVIAYLIMMLAPFPGLRQLALFAAAGLSAACLTVVCWYPYLVRGLPVRPVPMIGLMARWLAAWRRKPALRIGLPVALALFAVAGLSQLRINDDIAQLQALPLNILQQEREITALTGQSADQQWLVVYGDTPEATLQRLEKLAPQLAEAQRQGWLRGYRLLPLSSLQRQREDLVLLQAAAPGILARLASTGVRVDPPDLSPMFVTPQAWQQSPISEGWRLAWLSLANGQSGVLVPIETVHNAAALAKLADQQPGLAWIDRKAQFDSMFAFYRSLLGWLLAAAVAAIAASYVLRLGWRRGLVNVLPSLLSLACALATLAFSGNSLNLFSLLALVLVLGIGINYTLFFGNPRGTAITSLLAVTLALATTLLTLGILVFSSTQAISSFGIVLCSGIFTAFLLSPLAMPPVREKKK